MSFPSNPNDNDIFERFGRKLRYKASKGVWDVISSPTVAPIQEAVPTTSSVAQAVDLPMVGNEIGAMSYVQESNRLYVWNGSGWFEIALVNTNPTITDGGSATYELNNDGTPTVITLAANDPEGVPLTWSHTVSSGSLEDTTVTNTGSEFTITPGEVDATFNLTFTASDGVNIDTSVSSFSLSFGFRGEDTFAGITTEFVYHVFADPFIEGNVLVYGGMPGRLVYHELGASSTTWRKKYVNPSLPWTNNQEKYRAVAFDSNYIYHLVAGKNSTAPYAAVDVTKVSRTDGSIVGTSYLFTDLGTTSTARFEYLDCSVDAGKLYIVGMSTQNRMMVLTLNTSDLGFSFSRAKALNTRGTISNYGSQGCVIAHDNKVAIMSYQGSDGVVLETLSNTGTYTGGVRLLNDGVVSASSMYYYSGKYYCAFNSSGHMYLTVVNSTTFALEGSYKLRPDGLVGIDGNRCNVYVDASGIYIGSTRYLMKLDLSLTPIGAWKTTSNGSSLITPYKWSFNNGKFYFGVIRGTEFDVCSGSLDGSSFGVQYDYYNLAPVSFIVNTLSLGSAFTGAYSNGSVGLNTGSITTTNYSNYSVS